jgi:hypothetical protein
MAHARQQIREAVAAALTGLASTGTRVFQSRMRPQDEASLPALLVTTNDEEITTSIGSVQTRLLGVTVECIAQPSGAVDDVLDTIAEEVEIAMHNAGLFGGLVAGSELTSVSVSFTDELQKPCGALSMQYRFTYFTNAGAPGTII